jgi:[protein-PII] uridylyltransferase
METRGKQDSGDGVRASRTEYETRMLGIEKAFWELSRDPRAGAAAVATRSRLVDAMVRDAAGELRGGGIALVAVGGYGREEMFPQSDVDLMFLLDVGTTERGAKEAIQRVNQRLWDCGLRVSAMTRMLAECERFEPGNVEFTLSLLDARGVAGDESLIEMLLTRSVPKVVGRDGKRIASRLLDVTRGRRAKYGDTLFHLEPNVKECPGGLRDAHLCGWMEQLGQLGLGSTQEVEGPREFEAAREFLLLVRTFLHLRHRRDDNTLDWQAQDAAAGSGLGMGLGLASGGRSDRGVDAAYWMRHYFRHARAVERSVRELLDGTQTVPAGRRGRTSGGTLKEIAAAGQSGFELKDGVIRFLARATDPAHDPQVVLAAFATMAATGARLSNEAVVRMEQALPMLSADLEDGPNLWRKLQVILLGRNAGAALRAMHAVGMLELAIPEFHGIDALVIRDAYHRYTVDEHTFVVIDTIQELADTRDGAGKGEREGVAWANRFGQLYRDLPHPELLLLAALLHDTGKGHTARAGGGGHAEASVQLAAHVMRRLELDGYETGLVEELIRNHLEMSAALRRDVFDRETIRSFALRVPNPELLRMLTVFTYADIAAVHPDALTPWKAENLWRLYLATAAYLDRSVDEERVGGSWNSELLMRIHAQLPRQRPRVNAYLEGFPQRYLQTTTPEAVGRHIEMAWKLQEASDPTAVEVDFRYAPTVSELTVIARDRPMLFTTLAGVLAGWGMNILNAEAFSNAQGLVVDSFRFSDTFRTLELNESVREPFVASVRDHLSGVSDLELLLASRRRGRRRQAKTKVETRIDFDQAASSHSTLLQVVAQNTTGLLRALSRTLAEHGCNIEVALVDTEGETAIDVFYLTLEGGAKLDSAREMELRQALVDAIEANAR